MPILAVSRFTGVCSSLSQTLYLNSVLNKYTLLRSSLNYWHKSLSLTYLSGVCVSITVKLNKAPLPYEGWAYFDIISSFSFQQVIGPSSVGMSNHPVPHH
jgi:hypothetical protein